MNKNDIKKELHVLFILSFPIPKEHLFVNDVEGEKIPESYGGKLGYLSHFTTSYDGQLTVREYLTLAALMRIPGNISRTVERVEQIICEVSI